MRKALYALLVFCLLSLSGSLIYFRIQNTEVELFPQSSFRYWQVQTETTINQEKGKFSIPLPIPNKKNGAKLIDEEFSARNLSILIYEQDQSRTLVVNGKNKPQEENNFLYTAVLEQGNKDLELPLELVRQEKKYELKKLKKEDRQFFQKMIDHFQSKSSNSRVLRDLLANCFNDSNCLFGDFKKKYKMSEKLAARKLSALYAMAGIKSLVAKGFFANESGPVNFRYWVRTEIDGLQKNIFISNKMRIPATQLIFWDYYNSEQKTILKETAEVKYVLAPLSNYQIQDSSLSSVELTPFWQAISFSHLSLSQQLIFQSILLIPLGTLFVAFFRVFVGLDNYGTFMVVLISLAFREVGLLAGLVLLCLVVFVALLARLFLGYFNLLFIPRVSALLTIVVMIFLVIGKLSIAQEYLPGLSIAMFPVIILTMLIERMSIQIEEKGYWATLMLFISTLVISIFIYTILSNQLVNYWLLTFPELIFLILALLILIGRYTGYRVSELFRFKSLVRR